MLIWLKRGRWVWQKIGGVRKRERRWESWCCFYSLVVLESEREDESWCCFCIQVEGEVYIERSIDIKAPVSSAKLKSSLPWLPKKRTCDEESETLCWLLSKSTKFADSLNGLKSIA